jgi:hypothetical protein
MFLKCPYTILLYLFTFEMFLKCPYTILAVKRKVLLYKRMIRNRAMDNQTYSSSVIPFGYVGVKKEEKVVFPDGTVYFLSAFWMADPQLQFYYIYSQLKCF